MPLHVRLIFAGVVSSAVLGPAAAIGQEPASPAPCAADAAYRQFDFWVGEWDVFTPEGERAGTNRIEKLLRGCLLLESWTGAQGGEGKSINYYDPVRKRWVQTWVDGQGGIIAAEGELEDGTMRFEGEHRYPDGRREAYRMIFTPRADGSVRQFIEQSTDGGATWSVWFDGTYVRKQD